MIGDPRSCLVEEGGAASSSPEKTASQFFRSRKKNTAQHGLGMQQKSSPKGEQRPPQNLTRYKGIFSLSVGKMKFTMLPDFESVGR